MPAVPTPTAGQPGRHEAQAHHALQDGETTHAPAMQPRRAGLQRQCGRRPADFLFQMQGDQRTAGPPASWTAKGQRTGPGRKGQWTMASPVCRGKGSGSSSPQGLPSWRDLGFLPCKHSLGSGRCWLPGLRPALEQLPMAPGGVRRGWSGSWRDHPDRRPHCQGARRLLSSWAAFDLHLPFVCFFALLIRTNDYSNITVMGKNKRTGNNLNTQKFRNDLKGDGPSMEEKALQGSQPMAVPAEPTGSGGRSQLQARGRVCL